jgi:acetyltransferase-like isoleucine patch superfamily enzyme
LKNEFNFIQRIRNKIKVFGINHRIILEDSSKINITGCTIHIKGNNNTLHIKKNCRIKNATIEIIGDDCQIVIGSNVIVGYDCYLSSKEKNTLLEIGDNSMLSRNVKIMTSDGHPIYMHNQIINQAKSIIIGNNVWLTDNVTVLKGVTIGEMSIVGINSTLTKSIPAGVVATGNPAIVKKENINWKH